MGPDTELISVDADSSRHCDHDGYGRGAWLRTSHSLVDVGDYETAPIAAHIERVRFKRVLSDT